ncbi:hypothetical protein Ancab_025697 [Ancistrocladus abbreviatus]
MEKRYGFVSQGSRGWRAFRSEEFQEDDVWDVIEESKGLSLEVSSPTESTSSIVRRVPSAARVIPRANKPTHEPKVMQQHSAPIEIPDWSKIYGKSFMTSSRNASAFAHECHNDDDYGGGGGGAAADSDEDEDSDGDYHVDDGRLPPHEWLAKKLARNKISSFSVCEGVGRTLKGRDLSRVRNAVLTKTGFI